MIVGLFYYNGEDCYSWCFNCILSLEMLHCSLRKGTHLAFVASCRVITIRLRVFVKACFMVALILFCKTASCSLSMPSGMLSFGPFPYHSFPFILPRTFSLCSLSQGRMPLKNVCRHSPNTLLKMLALAHRRLINLS